MDIIKLGSLNLLQNSQNSLPHTNNNALGTILTDTFVVMGALAFLMVVIGGLRYIFAAGNAEKTSQAKRVISYSLMGLILAALAGSIVHIVIGRVGKQ